MVCRGLYASLKIPGLVPPSLYIHFNAGYTNLWFLGDSGSIWVTPPPGKGGCVNKAVCLPKNYKCCFPIPTDSCRWCVTNLVFLECCREIWVTPSPREEGGEGPITRKVSKNQYSFLGHLCGPVGVWGS